MIKVWFLIAVFGGGWAMVPFDTETACNTAKLGLSVAVVTDAECTSAQIIKPSSITAPKLAPLPPRKPGQGV